MTFDLPEGLVRQMKLRAVVEHKKLRDVAEEVLRRGLAAGPSPAVPSACRVQFPLIECRLEQPRKELTPGGVAEILSGQEAAWIDEAAGR